MDGLNKSYRMLSDLVFKLLVSRLARKLRITAVATVCLNKREDFTPRKLCYTLCLCFTNLRGSQRLLNLY